MSYKKHKVFQTCARLRVLLSEVPFYKESVVYIVYGTPCKLVLRISFKMASILCFLTIKYQFSNTLSNVCLEKMPRN